MRILCNIKNKNGVKPGPDSPRKLLKQSLILVIQLRLWMLLHAGLVAGAGEENEF